MLAAISQRNAENHQLAEREGTFFCGEYGYPSEMIPRLESLGWAPGTKPANSTCFLPEKQAGFLRSGAQGIFVRLDRTFV